MPYVLSYRRKNDDIATPASPLGVLCYRSSLAVISQVQKYVPRKNGPLRPFADSISHFKESSKADIQFGAVVLPFEWLRRGRKFTVAGFFRGIVIGFDQLACGVVQ